MKGNISEAYLSGDIDIEGDMLKPFKLRQHFDDRHPLVAAWRFIEPVLFGQVYTNKRAIASHYNADPKLFLSFLDPVFPAYSQGVYAHDDEPLAKALERKFDWAIEKCELGPGKTVLEIGPGWARSPVTRCRPACASPASPTPKSSQSYLKGKLPISATASTLCSPISTTTSPKEPFDAIVIMGVIEHLPDLRARAEEILPPAQAGGPRVPRRQRCEEEIRALDLHGPAHLSRQPLLPRARRFLNKLCKTDFEVDGGPQRPLELFPHLQTMGAEPGANKDYVRRTFGDFEFRKFRLYLWGAAYQFLIRSLECYRMISTSPRGGVRFTPVSQG